MSRIFKKNLSVLINKKIVTGILDNYFVDKKSFKYTLINKGLENVNVLVDTGCEKLVVRIYNPIKFEKYRRTRESILYEIEYMDYLRCEGMPIPKVIPTLSGKLYSSIRIGKAKYFSSVFEYIEGKECRITKDRIVSFAPIQAKMHLLSQKFKPRYVKESDGPLDYYIWWEEFKNTKKTLKNKQLEKELSDIIYTILKKINPKSIAKFPAYIIHSDLHKENMRFEDSQITGIFDFDDCREGIIPEDIATFLQEILKSAKSYKNMKDSCELFFSFYQRERKLSKKEKVMAIYFAMLKIYQLKYFDFYYSELAGDDLKSKTRKITKLIEQFEDFQKLAKSY